MRDSYDLAEVEVMQTLYPHPTTTSGQHANGPARIWIQVNDHWYPTRCSKLHRVRRELEENGPHRIMAGTWSEYGH